MASVAASVMVVSELLGSELMELEGVVVKEDHRLLIAPLAEVKAPPVDRIQHYFSN